MEISTLIIALCVVSALAMPQNVFEFEQLEADGQHWALLVAGSNGYFNYRHQVRLNDSRFVMCIV